MFDRLTDNANINEPQVYPVDQGLVTDSLDQEIQLPDADEQGSGTSVDFETPDTGKSGGSHITEQTEPTADPIMDSLDALGQNDKFKTTTKRDSGYSTKWLAENLIRQGDIVLIEGKPGAGATLLANGISGGLCRGIIFEKLATARNSRVLYLEGSMRQTDLENNVASLCEDGEELEINIKTAEEVYRITNGNILTLISPSWREHIKGSI